MNWHRGLYKFVASYLVSSPCERHDYAEGSTDKLLGQYARVIIVAPQAQTQSQVNFFVKNNQKGSDQRKLLGRYA